VLSAFTLHVDDHVERGYNCSIAVRSELILIRTGVVQNLAQQI